jgi:hypothetical protein
MQPSEAVDVIPVWIVPVCMSLAFIMNLLLARWVTSVLVEEKFIKRKSLELDKAKIMWWFPIVGFLGLVCYYVYCRFCRFWAWFNIT